MQNDMTSELITTDELCELLMIGKNTAYALLNSGKIKAFRIGRHWKIPKCAVYQYIKKSTGL